MLIVIIPLFIFPEKLEGLLFVFLLIYLHFSSLLVAWFVSCFVTHLFKVYQQVCFLEIFNLTQSNLRFLWFFPLNLRSGKPSPISKISTLSSHLNYSPLFNAAGHSLFLRTNLKWSVRIRQSQGVLTVPPASSVNCAPSSINVERGS